MAYTRGRRRAGYRTTRRPARGRAVAPRGRARSARGGNVLRIVLEQPRATSTDLASLVGMTPTAPRKPRF